MSRYLQLLQEIQDNPGQKKAVERDGHCVVIAGPGTGKTRTLILKAAKLLYKSVFPPRGIACVTFAHLMAEELRQRIRELGVPSRYNVFIGTLHGFCLSNILVPFGRLYEYPLPNPLKVASNKQQAEIYRATWYEFGYSSRMPEYRPERNREDDSWADRLPITFQKYRRTRLDGMKSPGANRYVEELVKRYERALLEEDLTDFDLQIKWSMQLVEQQDYVRKALEAKYPWILIDEYQDLGLPLHRMVKSLTANTGIKLFAIGDPNQCIYDFTGACPQHLRELEATVAQYGEPIYLTKNYRSRQRIVDAALVVAPSPTRLEAVRQDRPGYVACPTESRRQPVIPNIIRQLKHEFDIPYHRIMVLHRYWKGCRDVIDQIEQHAPDVPCFKAADQPYDARKPLLEWIERLMQYSLSDYLCNPITFRDLCEFWRSLLVSNGLSSYEAASLQHRIRLFVALSGARKHQDSVFDWLRAISKNIHLEHLLEGYGLLRPDDVEEYAKLQEALEPGGRLEGFSLMDMLDRIQREDSVFVGTLHSSKGQESDVIVIAGAEALNTWDVEAQAENKRLFYVGITRARDWLFVVHNRDRCSYLANQLAKSGMVQVRSTLPHRPSDASIPFEAADLKTDPCQGC